MMFGQAIKLHDQRGHPGVAEIRYREDGTPYIASWTPAAPKERTAPAPNPPKRPAPAKKGCGCRAKPTPIIHLPARMPRWWPFRGRALVRTYGSPWWTRWHILHGWLVYAPDRDGSCGCVVRLKEMRAAAGRTWRLWATTWRQSRRTWRHAMRA